jgi:nucleoside-triphosphatase THEP1
MALVASPRRGKTSLMQALAARLREADVPLAGVLQPPLDGPGSGYVVESVQTGERRLLACRLTGGPGYDFSSSGFEWAAKEILRPSRVLLIDEVGLLEAEGLGHFPALEEALLRPGLRAALLAVREESLPAIGRLLGPLEPRPFPPEGELESFLGLVFTQIMEVIS